MLRRLTICTVTAALLGACVIDYVGGVRHRDRFYSFSGKCLSESSVHGATFEVGRAWLLGYTGTPARAIDGISTDLAVAVDSEAFDPPPCPNPHRTWQPALSDELGAHEYAEVHERLDALRPNG
jgi:hypothetical protein